MRAGWAGRKEPETTSVVGSDVQAVSGGSAAEPRRLVCTQGRFPVGRYKRGALATRSTLEEPLQWERPIRIY